MPAGTLVIPDVELILDENAAVHHIRIRKLITGATSESKGHHLSRLVAELRHTCALLGYRLALHS
jgi:hypothetical protein